MARKSPKNTKSLFDKQSTKGGWQINNNVEQKKSGSGSFLLFLFFVIGVALIAGSFFLASGEKIVSITPNESKPDNNGKIVHVTGELNSESFTDPMFQISHTGIGLNRIVEIYQWVESGGVYNKEWKSEIVILQNDSAATEKHSNPSEMPFFSESWKVDKVKFGSFDLSESLEKKIINYKPIELTQEDFVKLNEHGQKAFKLFEGKYSFGLDPNMPNIGDLRVSFEAASAQKYTILAKQQGSTLVGYTGDAGLIEEARLGTVNLEAISSSIETSGNSLVTWILRGAGGVSLLLSVIVAMFGRKKTLTNMSSLKPVVNLPTGNPYKTAEINQQKESNKPAMVNNDFSNYEDEFAEEITLSDTTAKDSYNSTEPTSSDSFESDFQSPKDVSPDVDDFLPYNSEQGVEIGVEVIGGDDFYTQPESDSTSTNTKPSQNYDITDRIEVVQAHSSIKTLEMPESPKDSGIDFEVIEVSSELESDDFQIEEINDLPHPQDFQKMDLKENEKEESLSSVMDFVSKNTPQDFNTNTDIEIESETQYKKNDAFKP